MSTQDNPFATADAEIKKAEASGLRPVFTEHEKLQRTLQEAAAYDPDRYAEARRMAVGRGVDPKLADAMLSSAVKSQATRRSEDPFAEALRLSRLASEWIGKTDNARIAHDDLEAISGFDIAMARARRSTRGQGQDILAAGANGFDRMRSSFWLVAAAEGIVSPEEAAAQVATLQRGLTERASRRSIDARLFESRLADESGFGQALPFLTQPIQGVAFLGEQFVRSSPTVVAGAAGGALGGKLGAEVGAVASGPFAPGVAPVTALVGGTAGAALFGGAAGFLLETGGKLEEEMQDIGIDLSDPAQILSILRDEAVMSEMRHKAHMKGLGIASFDTIAMMLGLPAGLRAARRGAKVTATGLRRVREIGAGLARETAGEAAGEAFGQVLADGSIDFDEVVLEGIAGLGQSSAQVAISQGLARPLRAAMRTMAEAVDAKGRAEAVRDVMDAAARAKLHKRSPEALEELAAALAAAEDQEGGPLTARWDVETWEEVWRALGKDPAEALGEALPAGGETVWQDAQARGTVEIPFGEFVRAFAGREETQGLVDVARLSDDGITLLEAEGIAQKAADALSAAEEAAASDAKGTEARETPEDLSEQLAALEQQASDLEPEDGSTDAPLPAEFEALDPERLEQVAAAVESGEGVEEALGDVLPSEVPDAADGVDVTTEATVDGESVPVGEDAPASPRDEFLQRVAESPEGVARSIRRQALKGRQAEVQERLTAAEKQQLDLKAQAEVLQTRIRDELVESGATPFEAEVVSVMVPQFFRTLVEANPELAEAGLDSVEALDAAFRVTFGRGKGAASRGWVQTQASATRSRDSDQGKKARPQRKRRAPTEPIGDRAEEVSEALSSEIAEALESAPEPTPPPATEELAPLVGRTVQIHTIGRTYEARYEVREASALMPSHAVEPRSGVLAFNPAPGYPEGLQPRPYHKLPAEQGKVERFALTVPEKHSLYLGDSGTPTDGPPVIAEDGVVINGNGRAMALKLAQRLGKLSEYRAALVDQAQRLGIDPSAMEGMEAPVLVRVVDLDSGSEAAAVFAREGNEALTQAQTVENRMEALSGVLPESVLRLDVPEDLTLGEFLGGGSAAARAALDTIWRALPENIRPSFFSEPGILTSDGKTAITELALSAVLDREAVDGQRPVVQTMLRKSIPALAAVRSELVEALDIRSDIEAALRFGRDELDNWKQAEGQKLLGGVDPWAELTDIQALVARFIQQNVRRDTALRNTLGAYVSHARGSTFMGEAAVTPAEAWAAAESKTGKGKKPTDVNLFQDPVDEALPATTPTVEQVEALPLAGNTVSSLSVRSDVPNMASLDGEDFEVFDGVREVPMALLGDPPPANWKPTQRVKDLAEEIRASGEINPLIVVFRQEGAPYILEGSHRIDALEVLGVESIPAIVAFDENDTAEARGEAPTALPPTIEIDGVQRPTTDSTGAQIHPTEEGVRNFWASYEGPTDDGGRPLRLYHGTEAEFDTFERGDVGYHFGSVEQANNRVTDLSRIRQGLSYLTDRRAVQIDGSARVIPAYVSIGNPLSMDDVGDWRNPRLVFESLVTNAVWTDLLRVDPTLSEAVERSYEDPTHESNDEEFSQTTAEGVSQRTQAYEQFLSESESDLRDIVAALEELGYDGIVYDNSVESGRGSDSGNESYIAFDPTQIKSAIGNRGTFDPSSPVILEQRPSATTGVALNQTAYHGGPHRFDKFSLDAIGTGEGAQAFGWGLYFADRKGVAKSYRESLSGGETQVELIVRGSRYSEIPLDVRSRAGIGDIYSFAAGEMRKRLSDSEGGTDTYTNLKDDGTADDFVAAAVRLRDDAKSRIEHHKAADISVIQRKDGKWVVLIRGVERAVPFDSKGAAERDAALARSQRDGAISDQEAALAFYESVIEAGPAGVELAPPGALYTVDLAPAEDEYLLWDAPLSEQSEKVRKALEPFLDGVQWDKSGAGDGKWQLNRSNGKPALWRDKREVLRDAGSEDVVDYLASMKGETFYSQLVGGRTAQESSKALAAAGIPGIKYLDGGSRAAGDGTYNYVIFDEKLIDIVEVEQARGRDPQGVTLFNLPRDDTAKPLRTFDVRLLKGADKSTALHELGHVFFEILGDLASLPQAPPRIAEQYAKALELVGYQSRDDHLNALNRLRELLAIRKRTKAERKELAKLREPLELFARSWEAYLREGKAPTPELRTVFAMFREWFTRIYETLKKLAIGDELGQDARDLFDTLLATDEAIEDADDSRGSPGLPEQALLGLNEEELAEYRRALHEAETRAKEILTRDALRSQSRQMRDERRRLIDSLKPAARREVQTRPAVIALANMSQGKLPDGSDLPADFPQEKLDRRAVEKTYGSDSAIAKALRDLGVMVGPGQGGITPDQAAEAFGMDSGDTFVRAMLDARNVEAAVEREARVRAFRAKPELFNTPQGIRELAQRAVSSRERAHLLEADMRAILSMVEKERAGLLSEVASQEQRAEDAERAAAAGTAASRFEETIRRRAFSTLFGKEFRALLKEQAAAILDRKPLRAARPMGFLRDAKREARKAAIHVQRGEFELAAVSKRREMLAHELHRQAVKNLDKSDKGIARGKKLGSKSYQDRVAKAGNGSLMQMNKLLRRFGLSKVGLPAEQDIPLSGWLAQIDKETDGLSPDVMGWILDDGLTRDWKDLRPRQQKELMEAIEQIYKMASDHGKFLDSKRKGTIDGQARSLAGSIAALARRAKPLDVRDKDGVVKGFMAIHRALDSLAQQMDGGKGGGIAYDLLIRPKDKAAEAENADWKHVSEEFDRAFKMLSRADKLAWVQRKQIPGVRITLNLEERLMVALNYGNREGRERLLNTFTESELHSILATLEQRHADMARVFWELEDSFWDRFHALWKSLKGVGPPKVEAIPFKTRSAEGNEVSWRGGYHRLKYEGSQSEDMKPDAQAASFRRGQAMREVTRSGSENQRKQNVRKAVRLDFGVVTSHLSETIHEITHLVPIRDMEAIIKHPEVKQAILEYHGSAMYDQFIETYGDIAQGDFASNDAASRLFRYLRKGVIVMRLGLKISTTLINLSGMTNTAVHLGQLSGKGPAYGTWLLAKHMGKLLSHPTRLFEARRLIDEMSPGMAQRSSTFVRELAEGLRKGRTVNESAASKLNRQVTNMAFVPMAVTQAAVDTPTWLAAFEIAQEQFPGDKPKQIDFATRAVISAQSGGNVGDLVKVMRGGDIQKTFTTFMGYMVRILNLTAVSASQMRITKPSTIAKFAGDFFMLYVVPVIFEEFIRRGFRGDEPDDDKTPGEVLAGGVASLFMSQFIAARELSGIPRGFVDYDGPVGASFPQISAALWAQLMQEEPDEAFWRSVSEAAGMGLHLPSQQIFESAQGVRAWLDGDASAAAIFMGPPRGR